MALADLLRAVEQEAAAERAVREQRVAAEAASILAQAHEEANLLEKAMVATAEAVAAAQAEGKTANARLAAAAASRADREAAFQSLLADVRAELESLRAGEAYPVLFRALLAESRAALPDAREIHIDPRDLDLVRAVADDLSPRTPLRSWAGLELVGADRRTIRNTVEARLTNAEPLLRLQFMRWLASTSDTTKPVEDS